MTTPSSNTATPRVVLTMVVRKDSRAVERCIRSIRPLIDAWCIADTASTDDTENQVRHLLADLPGEYTRTRRDLSRSLSQALELARDFGDYALMIDADVEAVIDEAIDIGTWRCALTA